MTTKRSTKRALILSALSLLMCVSMFVGSTFAWFTDEVVSGNNLIISGNLDVVLEYKTNLNDQWAPVDETTKIFKEGALYEPGYTEVVFLRVSNAGSLALKYNLSVCIAGEKSSTNVNGEEFKLSDYLEIGTYVQDEMSSGFNYADILMPTMFGTREAALQNVTLTKMSEANSVIETNRPVLPGNDTAQVHAIVLTMPETVGNEANYDTAYAAPEIALGVKLLATQLVTEEDSFGRDYDKDAAYPVVVSNASELVAAVANGGNVKLGGNVALTEKLAVAAGAETVIDLNGNTISYNNETAAASAAIENKGTLTLKNGTVTYKGVGDPSFGYGTNTIHNTGKLVIDGAKIVNTTENGSSVAIDCAAGAELIINDGEIVSQKNAIRLCPFGAAAIKATINGGTITGSRAIQIQLPSNKPSSAPEISLTVNGGTFNGTTGMSLYSYSAGQSFANVNVTIAGGTFNNDVTFGGGTAADKETVVVTGGTFNAKLGRYVDTAAGWEDIAKP